MKISVARAHQKVARQRALTVAGVMSGTSADGIDVALVRIAPAHGSGFPQVRLLAHVAVPYPAPVRKRVLQVMNAPSESVAELSRLHWRLGQLYAEAVQRALTEHPVPLDLIGCHGQTVYHQGIAQRYLGGDIACTWQIGEASILASRCNVPVVSDFRNADLAAGGQGAPLVPFFDYVAFRSATRNRVLQNLGGIGNMTVIAAGASPEKIMAFDTGPANMVIDAITAECFHKKYDVGGAIAARGRVLSSVVQEYLAQGFFQKAPPKSAGREEFGREFAADFLVRCRMQSSRGQDAVATATALTAGSIGLAWRRFVQPALAAKPTDFIVSGGGANNATLMQMLGPELPNQQKIRVHISEEFGVPAAAKEAMAFALLAYRTWHGLPGNIPTATGASRAVVLGKITYA